MRKDHITLRTPENEARYQEYLRTVSPNYCFFCANNPTKPSPDNFKFFFLIENDYPYDAFYKDHYILALKRHVMKLKEEEEVELKYLLRQFDGSFDQAIYNFTSRQSIKGHFHIHLLSFK